MVTKDLLEAELAALRGESERLQAAQAAQAVSSPPSAPTNLEAALEQLLGAAASAVKAASRSSQRDPLQAPSPILAGETVEDADDYDGAGGGLLSSVASYLHGAGINAEQRIPQCSGWSDKMQTNYRRATARNLRDRLITFRAPSGATSVTPTQMLAFYQAQLECFEILTAAPQEMGIMSPKPAVTGWRDLAHSMRMALLLVNSSGIADFTHSCNVWIRQVVAGHPLAPQAAIGPLSISQLGPGTSGGTAGTTQPRARARAREAPSDGLRDALQLGKCRYDAGSCKFKHEKRP